MTASAWTKYKPPPGSGLTPRAEVLVRLCDGRQWYARVAAVNATTATLAVWGVGRPRVVALADVVHVTVLVEGVSWARAQAIAAAQRRAFEGGA